MFTIAKPLRAAALAASLFAGVGSASAEPGLLSQEAAAPIVGALMAPITPLLPSSPASTTSIAQIGDGNFASTSVTGGGNLAVIQQSGTNNRAVQAIEGDSSAMLLVQGGSNNSVLQASQGDRNRQLVGVSGNDNSVAYVQVGDDLAGVLDVRDAQNASVLAIQTPQSGRYMMPTGLRGIQNAAVVIVPGRMYVRPR